VSILSLTSLQDKNLTEFMRDDTDDEETQQNFYADNQYMKEINLGESIAILAE
jgi:hypothetical protein